jgi:hypothetical protein
MYPEYNNNMIVKKEIRAYRDKNRGISISREGPGK